MTKAKHNNLYIKESKYKGFKVIDSAVPSPRFGTNKSGIGDFNGDGIDDFCVVSSGFPKSIYATAYVIFGRKDFPLVLDLAHFDDSMGIKFPGIEDDFIAGSATTFFPKKNGFMPLLSFTRCSGADVNGDGLSDLIIGAPGEDVGSKINAGIVYVVFGSKKIKGIIDLKNLDGKNGFVIYGKNGANDYDHKVITDSKFEEVFTKQHNIPLKYNNLGDGFGGFVSNLGDINGDGVDDIGIGALLAQSLVGKCSIPKGFDKDNFLYNEYMPNGKVYVFYGKKNCKFNKEYYDKDFDGTNGFVIEGAPDDTLGMNITASDIDGDGLNDIVIGGHCGCSNNDKFWHGGKAYVIFGKKSFPKYLNVQEYIESSSKDCTGFIVHGKEANAWLGETVSPLGDVNGDGIDDILIDSRGVKNKTGEAYILFGNKNCHFYDKNIFTTDGSFDKYGTTLVLGHREYGFGGFGFKTKLGDINNDGINDILFTASGIFKHMVILYGKDKPWESKVFIDDITAEDGINIYYQKSNFKSKSSYIVEQYTPNPKYISYWLEMKSSPYMVMGVHNDGGNLGDINGDGYPDVGVNLMGKLDEQIPGELIIIYGPLADEKGDMHLDL